MEDTCSPGKNTKLYSFRVFSIIIPAELIIVFLEGLFIIGNIPASLGTALTAKGQFTLPESKKI